MSPFDLLGAVKTLTAAGATEDLEVAVVGVVARTRCGEHGRELSTRADLDNLREASRAGRASHGRD